MVQPKKAAISRKASRRKKVRSADADVVLTELIRATERAHAGNRYRWVQVGDLDFPYTAVQMLAAIAVAHQEGWLIVGGSPPHSVMITEKGMKKIV